MIFTFYSYKGGVGRSMALANIAELFFQQGLNVLMVDWDLEAPGLERFFPKQMKSIVEKSGVIDILIEFKRRMAEGTFSIENKESLFPTLTEYLTDVYPEKSGKKGGLSILSAGRRDNENFNDYVSNVRGFDWQDFYQNWEGELFVEWLKQQMEKLFDVVLVDSRTGISEIGGVCLYQLADVAVIFCAPNQQNIEGTYEIAKNISKPDIQELRKGLPLNIVIIPSRVEDRAEAELLGAFQNQFIEKFSEFLSVSEKPPYKSIWELKIPYVPYFAFNELVAVREKNKAYSEPLAKAFQDIGRTLASFMPLKFEFKDVSNIQEGTRKRKKESIEDQLPIKKLEITSIPKGGKFKDLFISDWQRDWVLRSLILNHFIFWQGSRVGIQNFSQLKKFLTLHSIARTSAEIDGILTIYATRGVFVNPSTPSSETGYINPMYANIIIQTLLEEYDLNYAIQPGYSTADLLWDVYGNRFDAKKKMAFYAENLFRNILPGTETTLFSIQKDNKSENDFLRISWRSEMGNYAWYIAFSSGNYLKREDEIARGLTTSIAYQATNLFKGSNAKQKNFITLFATDLGQTTIETAKNINEDIIADAEFGVGIFMSLIKFFTWANKLSTTHQRNVVHYLHHFFDDQNVPISASRGIERITNYLMESKNR